MKQLHLMIALVLTSAVGYTQSFYIATATKSGDWSDVSKWSYAVRLDGKEVTKVVIPKNITIRLDQSSDLETLGAVELEIAGTLELKSNRTLALSGNSKVIVKEGGVIEIDHAAKNEKSDKKNKKNEQITIGGVVKFDGNIDTKIGGPATAMNATGASPMGFSSNAMLPVNFVSFTATKKNDEEIALSWTTTDEVNNSHFEVQRSVDGISFKSVAFILPDLASTNSHLYRYNDKYTAEGAVYYRIRQVDLDGQEKFSSVRVLGGNKTGNDASIYVAANKTLVIDLKNTDADVMVRVVNLSGAIVSYKAGLSASERISVNASHLAQGVYVVQVSDRKGMFTTKKVLL